MPERVRVAFCRRPAGRMLLQDRPNNGLPREMIVKDLDNKGGATTMGHRHSAPSLTPAPPREMELGAEGVKKRMDKTIAFVELVFLSLSN
ncbi:hypothetical protein CDAR_211411 [Caerostris darwini]|uniref:Uncharacterized protein n=1 Tax=Caerostris darwini TaxID=1538125 RepID=A0AAV4P7R8_9ARAC|nr:hypothetical protein CDAR_211411 [Caerostris darwini]